MMAALMLTRLMYKILKLMSKELQDKLDRAAEAATVVLHEVLEEIENDK